MILRYDSQSAHNFLPAPFLCSCFSPFDISVMIAASHCLLSASQLLFPPPLSSHVPSLGYLLCICQLSIAFFLICFYRFVLSSGFVHAAWCLLLAACSNCSTCSIFPVAIHKSPHCYLPSPRSHPPPLSLSIAFSFLPFHFTFAIFFLVPSLSQLLSLLTMRP